MKEALAREEAQAIALRALVWTLREEGRAERLLALTGLTPQGLRAGAGEDGVLGAVLSFLESHEPDLVACAHDLDLAPEMLVSARRLLEKSCDPC